MPTLHQTRTIPSTSYSITRLWGAYLVNTLWEYILTMAWERIVVIVPWGDLPIISYQTKTIPNTPYSTRIIP